MTEYTNSVQGDIARFFREMREGARRQGNVVFALIFKEIKSRSGVDGHGLLSLVGVVLEPVIALAGIMLFFYFLRRSEVSGIHIALYMAVSYVPFGIIRRSLSSIPRSLGSNSAFYAYQQVKPFDSILARFILEIALTMIGAAVVLFVLWWFLDLRINFDKSPQLLGLVVMMMVTGFGCSLFFGTYGKLYPIILKVIRMVSRALFFLSAVIHPISQLQGKVGDYILLNPLAHFEEKAREYALGVKPYPGVTLTYPASFMLIMLFLGFVGYYVNRFEVLRK